MRIVNSPTNPFPGRAGIPMEERVMSMKNTANTGMTRESPPYSEMSRVCRRS